MPRGIKVDIDKYIANIEQYLKVGCSIHEACLHGVVPYRTVMDYYEQDEEVRKKIDRLSNTPILIARTSVVDGMAADPKLALDYLKNKKSDEFGTKEKKELMGEIEVKNINVNFIKPEEK